MVVALKQGAALGIGVDHQRYHAVVSTVPPAVRAELLHDLKG
jgi:hypothetical protein